MAFSKKESEKMLRLAQEGMMISKIQSEYFPEYDYFDIYCEISSGGEKSATGMRRLISNRFKWYKNANTEADRNRFLEEADAAMWHIYNNLKKNQTKLDNIRKVLSE